MIMDELDFQDFARRTGDLAVDMFDYLLEHRNLHLRMVLEIPDNLAPDVMTQRVQQRVKLQCVFWMVFRRGHHINFEHFVGNSDG